MIGMKNYGILLLSIVFIVAIGVPASATQYNPPWAHNYGSLFDDGSDFRPSAQYATNIQQSISYQSFYMPNYGAHIARSNMKDDAIFYVSSHGVISAGTTGGAIWFYNGTRSILSAENKGYIHDYPDCFLSDYTTELKDVLLAVYVVCWSGKTNQYFGNFVDISKTKGVDNVIGFVDTIYIPHAAYWSERFWYRCQVGPLGQHSRIRDNANGAMVDVMMEYGEFGGINSSYARYRIPYDYLDPARYGVV